MTVNRLLQEIRDVVALAAEYRRLTRSCNEYRGSVAQMVTRRAEVESCLDRLISKIDGLSSAASSMYDHRPTLGL